MLHMYAEITNEHVPKGQNSMGSLSLCDHRNRIHPFAYVSVSSKAVPPRIIVVNLKDIYIWKE